VVGWNTERFGEDYTIVTAGETGVGGVTTLRDDQKRGGTRPH